LFAGEIVTTRDDFGRETHLASGGAMLLKDSNPPIQALAPSILITPSFAEARGAATVKKERPALHRQGRVHKDHHRRHRHQTGGAS
jgi:hypothetical protein